MLFFDKLNVTKSSNALRRKSFSFSLKYIMLFSSLSYVGLDASGMLRSPLAGDHILI